MSNVPQGTFRSIIAALLCLFVAGCADKVQEARIVTQEIKVEVPVKRPVPAELMECGYKGAIPKWLPVEGHPDWAALDKDGQRFAREMIVTIMGCNAAWKAWATAP